MAVTKEPTPPKERVRFEERADLLDFLLEISSLTSQTLDLDRLLAEVAAIIKQAVPHDLFAIFLYNDRQKSLSLRHGIGHREELVKNLRLGLGEGIVGTVAATRQPLLVPDVRQDARYLASLDAVRSEMAVPMVARGKLVGVIDLQATRDAFNSEKDLALLSIIGSRVAFAIENARLHRRLQRNNQTLRTLADLARELSSLLDLNQLLERLAASIKQLINYDAFSIMLVNEQQTALMHHFSKRFDERFKLDNIPLGKGVTGAAALERTIMRVADTRSDPRYIPTHPDIRSELAVPLITQDRLIGVMDLESEALGFFTDEHARLLSLLAPQIAISVLNARLYEELAQREQSMEQDLRAARRLQKVLLPREAPSIPHLDVAFHSRAAREISGDIYDFFEHAGDYSMFAFGDSSGKGAAAALYGALVTGLLRSLAPRRRGPAMLMRSINETLMERKVDAQFVTLLVMLWDGQSRELIMANAGSIPPFVCRAGKVKRLDVGGVPLGLLEQQEYEETVYATLPGDVILLVSDGIEDQVNPAGKQYGQSRLMRSLPAMCELTAAEIVKKIDTDIEQYRDGAPVQDDQTIIVIKVS